MLPAMTQNPSREGDPSAAVHSIDRFVFSVPVLDEAERFYREFGLSVTRAPGETLELRTWNSPHIWGKVHAAPGPKRLCYLRYGIHARDVAAFRLRIERAGLACMPHPWADREDDDVWLRDPDGTALQLVVAGKVSPDGKGAPAVRPQVPAGAGAAPARSQSPQVRPRHLSHLLLFTPDVPRMVAFAKEILGLRMSDHSGDGIAFLHGAHGSDHHLTAFARSHAPGLHHSSWDVASIDDVGQGAEQMRAAGFGRGWGVGRHVLGSNYFHYVRDPWGSYAEYSHDIDFIPAGLEWPAADHPPEDSFYVWGPQPPDDFVTNYEQPG